MIPAHPCFLDRNLSQIDIPLEPKPKASVFLLSYLDDPCIYYAVSAAASQFRDRTVHIPLAGRPVAMDIVVKRGEITDRWGTCHPGLFGCK